MEYDTLLFAKREPIVHITLNRPEKGNAINLKMAEELHRAAFECEDSRSVRSVIISGAGKMFCVGGDLDELPENEAIAAQLKKITFHLHAATSSFLRMGSTVIMAVNGVAAGAGFSFAVAGDITLAAVSACFTMAYTKVGLTPDCGASYMLPRLIGLKRTKELLLTNRLLNSEEALKMGLVNQVIPDAGLLAEAEKIALELGRGPTRTFGLVKELLLHSSTGSLEKQMEQEISRLVDSALSEDGREGINAFLNKRRPKFQGS